MDDSRPRFSEFVSIEEELVKARLRAARAAIDHPGEKGRALEEYVHSLLRSFLPNEYGLTTGFIAYHDGDAVKLSKQLDVIIYDSLHCAPLIRLATCEILPLEAVYGYVEIKASLASSPGALDPVGSSIEKCLMDNRVLRSMNERRYWKPTGDSPSRIEMMKVQSLGLRSYVFAFEWGRKIDALAQAVSNQSKKLGPPTHMHGVYAADSGFLYTDPIDTRVAIPDDYYHTVASATNGLLVFKTALFQALATFPRPQPGWVPAIEHYLDHRPDWRMFKPITSQLKE